MKKTFLPLALFALLLSSCCEDSGDIFWNVVLPDTPATGCDSTKATPFNRFSAEGALPAVPVADGSKVLLASNKALYWTDLRTGALLRKIESPVAGKAFTYPDAVYRHGDLAVAASGTSLAVFNVKTGELAWERALGDCDIDLGVYGSGDQFFVTQTIMEPDGVKASTVFMGHLQEPNRLDPLFTPAYSRTVKNSWAGYGRISSMAPFAGADGHAYILIAFYEPKANSNTLIHFMGLYDVTARSWVYERQPIDKKFPNYATGIQHMVIAGASAYLGFEDKLLDWDLTEGKIRDSIVLFNAHHYGATSYASARNLWVNDRYIVVETDNSGVQVFDEATHAALRRIDTPSGAVRADIGLDRLLVTKPDLVEVYAISTGRKLETIIATCEGFSGNTAVWKDAQGYLQMAVAGTGKNIYHYSLQP